MQARAFARKNAHFALDLAAAGALAAVGAARLLCADRAEAEALAVAAVLLFGNLLNVLLPFQTIGASACGRRQVFLPGYRVVCSRDR